MCCCNYPLPYILSCFVLSSLCPCWSSLYCSGWASMETLKVSHLSPGISFHRKRQHWKSLKKKGGGDGVCEIQWYGREWREREIKERWKWRAGRTVCLLSVQGETAWRGETGGRRGGAEPTTGPDSAKGRQPNLQICRENTAVEHCKWKPPTPPLIRGVMKKKVLEREQEELWGCTHSDFFVFLCLFGNFWLIPWFLTE